MDASQKTRVDALLEKASKADDGGQAQHFSQAACNAANAYRVLDEIERANRG